MDTDQEKVTQEVPPGFVYKESIPEGFVYKSEVNQSTWDKINETGAWGMRSPTSVVEGIASLGTGVAGFMGGVMSFLPKLVYDIWKSGGREGSPEEAYKYSQKVGEAISTVGGLYKPEPGIGQEMAKAVAYPFAKYGELKQKGIEKITDDPNVQAALNWIGDTVLLILPKLGHGIASNIKGRIKAGKAVTVGEIKKIVEKTPDASPEIKAVLKDMPDEVPLKSDLHGGAKEILPTELKPSVQPEPITPTEPVMPMAEAPPVTIKSIKEKAPRGWELTEAEHAETMKGIPKTEQTTTPSAESAKMFFNSLRQLKPLRRQQEASYTAERGPRLGKALEKWEDVGGEKGAKAALGELAGPYQKVLAPDVFESIRGQFPKEVIDDLFSRVQHTKLLDPWDRLSASKAMMKIFGQEEVSPLKKTALEQRLAKLEEQKKATTNPDALDQISRSINDITDQLYQSTKLPQKQELNLLSTVFGPGFSRAIMSNWSTWDKAKRYALEGLNVPRSIMASFDLSAPLRQGLFLIGRPQWYKAFASMFKYFGSEKASIGLHESIVQHPNYQYAKGRLNITEFGIDMTKMEERFMSPMAEEIPIIGGVVKASERAYSGFLNKLRFDSFNALLEQAQKLGMTPDKNFKLLDEIAGYINAATGRGNLPKGLENSAVALNAVFFSPRLMASRLKLLNPWYYTKSILTKDPAVKFVRQQAIRDLLSVTIAVNTVTELAGFFGAKVENDPSSTDFRKIRIGNTRLDPCGGFQQYIVLGSRILKGQTKSSVSGKITPLWKGFKPSTPISLIEQTLQYKLSPVASFIYDFLQGPDEAGKPFNLPKESIERIVPMMAQDIWDIAQDDPSLIPLSLFGVFGTGVQTYKPKKTLMR